MSSAAEASNGKERFRESPWWLTQRIIIICEIIITAKQLFRLLDKYRPETRAARKARLKARADSKSKGKDDAPTKRALSLKQGANSVVRAIEQKKAQLVVIAHDVDPLEVIHLMKWHET